MIVDTIKKIKLGTDVIFQNIFSVNAFVFICSHKKSFCVIFYPVDNFFFFYKVLMQTSFWEVDPYNFLSFSSISHNSCTIGCDLCSHGIDRIQAGKQGVVHLWSQRNWFKMNSRIWSEMRNRGGGESSVTHLCFLGMGGRSTASIDANHLKQGQRWWGQLVK